jgi:type II pantothenate kinase
MTAANFGKLSDMASSGDIALSIINMVFETAAMLGIFAARSKNLHDIVLTGNLTSIPQAKPIFEDLQKIFDVNFIIPEHAQFATAIGAALA